MEETPKECFLCQDLYKDPSEYEIMGMDVIICTNCIGSLIESITTNSNTFDHFFDLFGYEKQDFLQTYGKKFELEQNNDSANMYESEILQNTPEQVQNFDEDDDYNTSLDDSDDFDPNEIPDQPNAEDIAEKENIDSESELPPSDPTKFQPGICQTHKKKNEIVCLDHKVLICPNCALFGQHKGHAIMELTDVLNEMNERADLLKKTSKETKNKETFIKDGSLLNSLNSKIEQKKNEVKKIMEDRFRDYIDKINAKRDSMIADFENKVIQMKQNISEELVFPQKLKLDLTSWKLESQEALDTFDSSQMDNKIAYRLLSSCSGPHGDIIQKSRQLVDEMIIWQKEIEHLLDSKLDTTSVNYKDQIFENFLDNFTLNFESEPPVFSMPSHGDIDGITEEDDNLFESHVFDEENDEVEINHQRVSSSQRNIKKNPIKVPPIHQLNNSSSVMNFTKMNQGAGLNMTPRGPYDPGTQHTNNLGNYQNGQLSHHSVINKGQNFQQSPDNIANIAQNHQNNFMFENEGPRNNNPANIGAFSNGGTTSKSLYRNSSTLEFPQNNMMGFNAHNTTSPPNIIPQTNQSQMGFAGGFNNQMFIKSPPTELTLNSPDDSDSVRTTSRRGMDSAKGPKRGTSKKSVRKGPKNPVSLTQAAKKMLKRKLKINLASNKGYQLFVNCSGDSVDMTGCNLGDEGCSLLYKQIKKNSNVKNLKMMKNNITDDGASILLRALVDNNTLETLNLNINKISEATIDRLKCLLEVNKTIRKVSIKMNKISARNQKSVIGDLKKVGIDLEL